MNDNKIRNKFTEMSKIFKDVIDEYESLKSENKELNLILEDFGECDNERRKLKEENKRLKEQINVLKAQKSNGKMIRWRIHLLP